MLNENGQTVQYGSGPEDYLGDVLTGKAVQVIRSSAGADQPFFLYVLPFNPHSASVAAPRDEGMFADAELPRPPSFNEVDVSDKPAFIRRLPFLNQEQIAYLEYEYRRRIASGDRRHGGEHCRCPWRDRAAREHLRHLYLR